jgi:hypothetical protein
MPISAQANLSCFTLFAYIFVTNLTGQNDLSTEMMSQAAVMAILLSPDLWKWRILTASRLAEPVYDL